MGQPRSGPATAVSSLLLLLTPLAGAVEQPGTTCADGTCAAGMSLIQSKGHVTTGSAALLLDEQWPHVTGDMLPEVKELFTFGAPGTGNPAAWNPLRTHPTQWCFPGLRIYKEAWKHHAKYKDFAAALCCQNWHARQDVVVLYPEGSPNPVYWGGDSAFHGRSMYKKCYGGENKVASPTSQPWDQNGWPVPGTGSFDSIKFHNYYAESLRSQILQHWDQAEWYKVDGARDRDQFIRAFPGAEITSGLMTNLDTIETSGDVQKMKDSIERRINGVAWPPHDGRFNMKLVGAMNHKNRMLGSLFDDDLVLLVQQQGQGAPGGFDDNGCILAFEGTDQEFLHEFLRSMRSDQGSFCGSRRHKGFASELRGIMRDPQWRPNIRDKLGKCSSVTVAGFSLGGAVAEIFAFCAHRPDHSSVWTEDFRLLAWQSGPKNKTGQRLPEFELA